MSKRLEKLEKGLQRYAEIASRSHLPETFASKKVYDLDETRHEIGGLASSFASIVDSSIGGPTQIAPGAFAKTVSDWRASNGSRPIPLLWSHDQNAIPVGLVTELYESMRGLEFKAELDSFDARSNMLEDKITGGMINGISIGFEALQSRQGRLADGRNGRIVTEIRLYELSLVNWPADDAARIETVSGKRLTYQSQNDKIIEIIASRPALPAPKSIAERAQNRNQLEAFLSKVVESIDAKK